MGFSDERARASLRFSLSRFNTRAEIDQALEILPKLSASCAASPPRRENLSFAGMIPLAATCSPVDAASDYSVCRKTRRTRSSLHSNAAAQSISAALADWKSNAHIACHLAAQFVATTNLIHRSSDRFDFDLRGNALLIFVSLDVEGHVPRRWRHRLGRAPEEIACRCSRILAKDQPKMFFLYHARRRSGVTARA